MKIELRRRCASPICLSAVLLTTPFALAAEVESPYAGLEKREVKALSEEQIAAYEAGLGMGLAMAAELNGYPGPKHVLELRDSLELSEAQWNRVQQAFDAMQSSAVVLGKQIVGRERQLDQYFATQSIDAEKLEALVGEIADLQGDLRLVHLQAHLRMKEILTAEQIASYIRLRGYQAHAAHPGHASTP